MGTPEAIPNPDTVAWLLDGDPSVRYFTLTRLLGEPADGVAAMQARERIMAEGTVPAILAAQRDDGHWGDRDRFYAAKYTGTVWQLIVLAELGADGRDERVRRGCEAILRDSQDDESGGFSVNRAAAGGGRHGSVIPCLTGNLVVSLIRLGYLDDPRVRRGIDWITTFQRFDDADGVEFLLRHHVHRRSHDLARDAKPGWRRFGFPLMYQTDVLEILGILTTLGVRDDRTDQALALVAAKQDADGRWDLANTFNGRFIVDVEAKGAPSRWITARALDVLAAQRSRAAAPGSL